MAQAMHLTSDQVEAIKKGKAVRLVLPEAGTDIVLMNVETFEELRELAEDKALQHSWLRASNDSAVAWMKENPY
jgi:hypothetical protein